METFVTVIILSLGMAAPIVAAFNFVDTLAQVSTTVSQVDEILKDGEQEHGTQPVSFADHNVAVKNVSFGYHDDKEILHGVSLDIPQNGMTALVGPSGSGRSTLAKLAAILLWANGTMTFANALMTLVVSFMVFSQIKLFGMGVSMLRLTAAAIDRTVETEQMPRMDENGKALSPEKHDIVFDHVDFSYEKKPILQDITVTLPDKTTTTVIGPSGSGKTTFCNLIARFWDVDSGSVKIGGSEGGLL